MHVTRALAALALGLTAAARLAAQTPAPRAPEVLRVSTYADDGSPGTLRAAIATSNAAPGRYRIEIPPLGPAPYVITLKSALPAIVGPLQIEGTGWKQTGDYVAIDGSGYVTDKGNDTCPGAVAGQYGANVRTTSHPGFHLADTTGVDISGLEIRRFCIGILIHRSSNSSIHDNRIVGNRGGAGVLLTGDDGQGNPTGATTIHNKVQRNEFLDNGDGLELTRGAAFNLVADNVFRSTSANPEPAQGIEILRGHDNVLARNRFEGYSDGVQINAGDRNILTANTFTDNTFGVSVTGAGNVIEGNTFTGNAVGVAVRPTSTPTVVRLTENAIYGNGLAIARCEVGGSCDPKLRRGGIIFGMPSGEHAEYVGKRGGGIAPPAATSLQHICPNNAPNCQPVPNGGITPPALVRVQSSAQGVTVSGRLQAEARRRYVVELFGNTQAAGTEGEVFLGRAIVVTGADGSATFDVAADRNRSAVTWGSFTATATSADGATSEFSAPIAGRRN